MEYRLVLNNRSEYDIPNNVLSGQLHQDLKYYKFRRVPSKIGKPVFYLFFRKEEETYYALRAAKSMKNISLVRYRHREHTTLSSETSNDIAMLEIQYRPVPPQDIVDLIRHNFSNYLDKFHSKSVFKEFVRRVSEQIIIQGLEKQEGAFSLDKFTQLILRIFFVVCERISKLNHWWWLNKHRFVDYPHGVQKLLDIFFV